MSQTRFVTSKDGTRIACQVSGSGPPLVMVYGALSDNTYWRRLAPFLEPHFELYAMERRGHGESGDNPAYEVGREVEDIVAVLQPLSGPAFLFGHSAGAVLALLAAMRAPERVGRLVLYEPPFTVAAGLRAPIDPDLAPRLAGLVAEGRREEAMETFFREAPQVSEEDIQRQKNGPLWPALTPLAHTLPYDVQVGRLAELSVVEGASLMVPTLLLYGELSPEWMRQAAIVLAPYFTDATLVELPGQGHAAAFTGPELLAGEITRFLQGS